MVISIGMPKIRAPAAPRPIPTTNLQALSLCCSDAACAISTSIILGGFLQNRSRDDDATAAGRLRQYAGKGIGSALMTARSLAKAATGANSTVASGKANPIPVFVKAGMRLEGRPGERVRKMRNLEPHRPFDGEQGLLRQHRRFWWVTSAVFPVNLGIDRGVRRKT